MAHQSSTSPYSDLWRSLHEMGPREIDCSGKVLFRRGDSCRGIYMVEEGYVRLLLAPELPQEQEVVGSGAVLGLAETMGGGDYKLTAEALRGARVTYIERKSLIRHLHVQQQLCLQIVHLLSEDLHSLYHRFRQATSIAKRKPGSSTVQ